LPAAWILNVAFRKERALRKAINRDEFESLVLRAADKKRAISITMDSNKVYVGFVVGTSDPSDPRKDLSFLPLVSGYRDSETHELTFTTYYTEIYGRLTDTGAMPPPLNHLMPDDFVTVIPVSKIASIHLFDFAAYRAFTPRERVRKARANGKPKAKPSPI
jgi:hypothetical protein